MLIENRINDDGKIVVYDKVKVAIERIKFAYEVSTQRGLGCLYVAYSGGKDSTVLAELARLAEVPYTLNYNVTGLDPPELIYFMRDNYNAVNSITEKPIFPAKYDPSKKDLYWHMYQESMWQLIIKKKMPPRRIVRYCCSELKERGGQNKVCLTGVRWDEGIRRRKRRAFELFTSKAKDKILFNDNDEDRKQFESCQKKGKLVCNPIVEWLDVDVWDFIKMRNLPYCKLYDEGMKRLGCIGCPMGNKQGMMRDFTRYPKFKTLYINAFDRMIRAFPTAPNAWKNGQEVFDWWISNTKRSDENQLEFQL